jgi:hypothetical protein
MAIDINSSEAEILAHFAALEGAKFDAKAWTVDVQARIDGWIANLNRIATHGETYSIKRGRKFHHVIVSDASGNARSSHAHVDDDGFVYKSGGWKGGPQRDREGRPAKRYDLKSDIAFERLAENKHGGIDEYGGYLYQGGYASWSGFGQTR